MKKETLDIFNDLFKRYPDIQNCQGDVEAAFQLLNECFRNNHRLYLCGNGGSASDCEHIVGELLKNFKKHRKIPMKLEKELDEDTLKSLEKGYQAISLCNAYSFMTAYANDHDPDFVFAQQLSVLGQKDDVLMVLSTSGQSKNCILAVKVAKALGLKTIALTGRDGGLLKKICDVSIIVPEQETYKIQERHLPIYHALCAMIEEELD